VLYPIYQHRVVFLLNQNVHLLNNGPRTKYVCESNLVSVLQGRACEDA